MKLETIKGSENYQCQIIKLPVKKPIPSLDNLVEVVYQGNSCLVGKDSNPGSKQNKSRLIDDTVDSKMVPEHLDTSQLFKNIHKLNLTDTIAVTYKLHGTSARYYNTLVKRKLSPLERISRFFGAKIQEGEYKFVCASRRVIKSVDGKEVNNKQHYYSEDLWSAVGKNFFEGKLNQGEAVYCEIIGKDYTGKEIQPGYSYGFNEPKVYIYRISNINSQGIEVDLSYQQMKLRAEQLGIETCPELYYGDLIGFYGVYDDMGMGPDRSDEEMLNNIFYNVLLEQPSILDKSVIEEGFCVRKCTCNKPEIYKIKAKSFILKESKQLDKEIIDIEEEENV